MMSCLFRNKCFLCVFILIKSFYFSCSYAQDLNFETISHKDGLPQRSVLSVYQDGFGFMWFGTRDGLCRYDGYEFVVYRHQTGNPTSIGGNTIFSISGDNDGNIWIATDKGLSCYHRNHDKFTTYTLPSSIYESSSIHEVFVGRDGRVWMGCRYGLFEWNRLSGLLTKHSFVGDGMYYLAHGTVSSIAEDRTGMLWVGTSKLGLFTYNPTTRQGCSITSESDRKQFPSRIESLVVTDSVIWAATYGSGLFLLEKNGEIIRHWHTQAVDERTRLQSDLIRDLRLDQQQRLWVGTFEGLYQLAEKGMPTRVALGRFIDGTIQDQESIRAIHMDKLGNIWVGTYTDGIKLYRRGDRRFRLNRLYGAGSSTSSTSVSALLASRADTVLVGTEDGVLYHVAGDHNTRYELPENGAIKAIYEDRNGQVWLGVFGKGLYSFSAATGSFQKYELPESVLLNRTKGWIINSIAGDTSGLWIGTDGAGGLHRFDLATKRFVPFEDDKELQELLNHRAVKHVSIGKDGQIFLATYGHGVVIYNSRTGAISHKSRFRTGAVELRVDQINHVLEEADGTLWLSSNGQGVLGWNPRSGDCKHFHAGNGMLDNLVYGTIVDRSAEKWFVSLHGVSRLDKNDRLRPFGYEEGMLLEEINEGAFAQDISNSLLLGGSEGWLQMDMTTPHRLSARNRPVRFTTLRIGNHRVEPGDSTRVLQTSLQCTQAIQLSHRHTDFELEFSDFGYSSANRHSFYYKLEGIHEEWIRLNGNQVAFTNLKAGDYTLKVRSTGDHSSVGEAQMSIEVLDPLWLSWWAKCLYLLSVGLIVALFWSRYLQSLRLKHSYRIEQLEKEKWKEIHDVKLSYFMDVSHEFRTPLSLILAPLEELLAAEEHSIWKKNRLEIMHFNVQRLRLLTEQIMQIREIDTGQYAINKEPVPLRKHLEEILMSFWPMAEKQNIQLLVDLEALDEVILLLDKDKIEKIIFNLLQNAFKFTPPKGEIGISASFTDSVLALKVWDTGVGINEKDLPHIFERFYTKGSAGHGVGIGLSVSKSLLEMMDGHITVDSEVARGTSFMLTIPCEMLDTATQQEEDQNLPSNKLTWNEPVEIVVHKDETDNDVKSDLGTILLVDDNAVIVHYLEAQLKTTYKVFTAYDGLQGLQKAEELVPDLIISDLVMPGLNGYELCASIKSKPEICHIPLVLLTAMDTHAAKMEGLGHGADAYLPKPFHILELKLRIKNIIDHQKRIHTRYRAATYLPNSAAVTGNDHDRRLLDRINTVISENLESADLSVEWLGAEVGLSRVHLFRKIKSLTGLSPSEYIKNYKMKYACQLLTQTDLRVAEVAFRVGFQDSQYFAKVFKKEIGKSPTAFMNTLL
ncbi:two-component regulator propeller domain-containing protein [Sphingobacterium sp. SGR-19]|uniref:hybrid sensor histidine kinase/response regulator transcription factor n=1 Tax=Sphingobacterium sp. SGR-19 TaxID=2710886 RepID=UPI0013EA6F7E|nr:two-component regulator propeller domain-containing protein [Sphingobacterium sp. SGR-19]NGM67046.1 response regulator [Sphingobacterium sp. SGR-19]